VDFDQVLSFIASIADRLKIDTLQARVGVATFATEPNLVFNLNEYLTNSEVENAIRSIKYSGGKTDTAAALQLVFVFKIQQCF